MLEQLLKDRNVLPLPTVTNENWSEVRASLVDLLCTREYGQPVPAPDEISFEIVEAEGNHRFCAGLGDCYRGTASGTLLSRPFSFPFTVCLPKSATKENPAPFFVLSNFHEGEPNMYLPIEEIIDRGYAVLYTCYKSVTSDDNDFTTGIASCLYPDGERKTPDATGKLQMWAWANMRVLDYALTDPRLDASNAAVIGHSRLGKTALVTGMMDERFRYVISNDSGCSGAAITSRKQGENIAHITKTFPFWFCPAYQKLAGVDETGVMPFEQHMLLATIAPRTLFVGSAKEDIWADPDAEKLACFAASPVWVGLGQKGFIAPDALPEVGDDHSDGDICYHLRPGVHFLSRLDWVSYMNAIDKKMNK